MSIEINWESLTSGPDGEALAESIREFIHDRFQKVTLPKFIRSVHVHSFDFGSVAPELELKDVCDPLPDFYEGDGEDGDESIAEEEATVDAPAATDSSLTARGNRAQEPTPPLPSTTTRHQSNPQTGSPLPRSDRQRPRLDTRWSAAPHMSSQGDPLSSFLSRASTPGIPGGTSNVNNYFHLPLSAGLNGAQTPFAAVAGAHGWPERYQGHVPLQQHQQNSMQDAGQQYLNQHAGLRESRASASPPPLPSQEGPNHRHRRQSSSFQGLTSSPLRPEDAPASPLAASAAPETSTNDVQIVAHLRYSGDIKLTLTADILLDYPMPSFVGIPLQLRVTGLSFDGVAILAYIRRRAHFCFLAPEDAEAVIGANPRSPLSPELGARESFGVAESDAGAETRSAAADGPAGQDEKQGHAGRERSQVGGLFEDIKVESEIGQQHGAKPVLKNVGKVERFVLDQVRRIFEQEFVYPSFWTFLV